MELKTFVKETLVQIVEGVKAAQAETASSGAKISPGAGDIRQDRQKPKFIGSTDAGIVEHVGFDLAVSRSDASTKEAGAGIFVWAIRGLDEMTNETTTAVPRRDIAVRAGWLLMLVIPGVLGGCGASGSKDQNFETLLRMKDQLRARYGEHLSMHETNVILDTTLNAKAIQEIDYERNRDNASEWEGVDWKSVRHRILKVLREQGLATGNEPAAGVKCALSNIDPPIETWTETSAFPFSVKSPRAVWDKAVLLFNGEKLVDIIPVASSQ